MATGISRRRFVSAVPCIATALFASGQALADYPERPITLIAPFAAGGIVDIVARVMAPILSMTLSQPVIVVNKAGAAGIVGDEFVAHARPMAIRCLLPETAPFLWAGLSTRTFHSTSAKILRPSVSLSPAR